MNGTLTFEVDGVKKTLRFEGLPDLSCFDYFIVKYDNAVLIITGY